MNQLSPEYNEIVESGLFSAEWYLDQYQDVAAAGRDALEHYLKDGASEGRDPAPDFSTTGYLARYQDAVDSDLNPLVHYIRYGKKEGYLTAPPLNPRTIKRPYRNFAEYLTHSVLDPLVKAPFSSVDLDSFALMDQVGRWLCLKQKECRKTPLVSVIMPMRDRAHVVGDAVRSVLEQSYVHFELIVIDDGSQDASLSVVRSFADPRIQLSAIATPSGVSAARNRGLSMAKGELIAYLDSDNTWRPDFLRAMVGAFEVKPEVDAAYGGQYLYRGCEQEPFAVRFGSYNPSLLRNHNYIDLNCFVHRRDVLETTGGGFCEKIKRWVDWEFILRVGSVGKIYSVPILQSNYFMEKVENTITVTEELEPARRYIMGKAGYRSQSKTQTCIEQLSRKVARIVVAHEDLKNIEEYTTALDDSSSDVLLLGSNAMLTPGTLTLLQKAAYTCDSIAIAVPQYVLPGGEPTINTHVPYAFGDVPCDVTLSSQHKNIATLPLFHDGSTIDLDFAPFSCVYIKREVWDICIGLAVQQGKDNRPDRIICDFIRHVLNKRIVYIPEAIVLYKKTGSSMERDGVIL